MVRRATLLGCVSAVLLMAPPGALATTVTAHSGNVSATFSYTGTQIPYRNLTLTISQAGQVRYSAPVRSRSCSPYCSPAALGPHQSSLRVLDLQSNGRPDVALGLFSGGAHCCFIDQVFSYDPGTMTYAKSERDFGNSGAALERLNGHYVFVGADNAFYYEYASFAYSGAPIQIFEFNRSRHFLDVTRRYPSPIKADAAVWWKAFTHNHSRGEGFIAAWAADEYLLAKVALVNSTLQTELRNNHLHSDLPGVPSGKQFIAALKKFLVKHGYAR